MSYGIIEYNEDGLPKCEICGEYFIRVLNHTRYKHSITAIEYKRKFGFDIHKGICSKESSELSRKWNALYSKTVIDINLKQEGKNTRFEKGSIGRPKSKVSEQTRIRLVERGKIMFKKKDEL